MSFVLILLLRWNGRDFSAVNVKTFKYLSVKKSPQQGFFAFYLKALDPENTL
jgi:hypothetical protein